MKRTIPTAMGGLAAILVLAACANDPQGGQDSAAPSGLNDLEVQSSIEVPDDARRPAGDGKASCPDDLTIGYVGAMTGPNAQLGIYIYNASELAIDQHNEANPDCQVKFKKFDTEGDPNKATGPVTQAVNEDNIIGVIGLPFSGESKATGKIFEDAGLVHITPSATNPALATNGWRTFFRGLGNDDVQGPAVADFATKIGADSVYVIGDDSDYGVGLAKAAQEALGDRLAGSDRITTGQKDFAATVSKVMAAEPDAVFYAGYYPEAAPLNQQLVGKGFKSAFIGPDGVKDALFIKLAGDSSANGYFTCPCLPGELIPDFADAYEGKYKETAGTYTIEGYDATTVLLAGIDAGNHDRESLLKFVTGYEGQGFSKKFAWNETGELTDLPVFGYKVQDGEIVSVGRIN